MKSTYHTLPKICVSGVPDVSGLCNPDALQIGRDLGRALAAHSCILTTTSTTGFPLWSAIGTKQEGGLTIAFSPAANQEEHVVVYKLPTDYFDTIVYTGFGSAGAGVLALRSSDAVIFGCGGMSTLLEATMAITENKPIGILAGPWDTDEALQEMMLKHYPDFKNFVVDNDPKRLLEQILKKIKAQKK